MKFNASVHTPDALASQLEDIYRRRPDTLLLGSLGRAVIFGEISGNPVAEFEARQESPVWRVEDSEALSRDIDVIGIEGEGVLAPQLFEVDSHAFGSPRVRFVREGDDWFLVSENKGIYEPLHPASMELVEGETVYGVQVKTVPFQTHQALFGLKGSMRPKDQINLSFLSLHEGLGPTVLPPEVLEPFEKLRRVANSGIIHHGRRVYRTVVPITIRKKVYPLTGAIKERLL